MGSAPSTNGSMPTISGLFDGGPIRVRQPGDVDPHAQPLMDEQPPEAAPGAGPGLMEMMQSIRDNAPSRQQRGIGEPDVAGDRLRQLMQGLRGGGEYGHNISRPTTPPPGSSGIR